MIGWYKHHIVPRHIGGTDEPSNILKCNLAMHAFLHKILWQEFGRWQDCLAWKGMTGQIGSDEILYIRRSQGAKSRKGYKQSTSHRYKIGRANTGKLRPNLIEYNKTNKIRSFVAISPEGVSYNITNLRDFCRQHNLHQGCMSNLASMRTKYYKGWACKKLEI